MSFVLEDQWAVRCDVCGSQTDAKYETRQIADLVCFNGGDSSADETVDDDTRHLCPCCRQNG